MSTDEDSPFQPGVSRSLDGPVTPVPSPVQEALDRVVDATHRGATAAVAKRQLLSWLGKEGDEFVADGSGEYLMALGPQHLEGQLSRDVDDELRDYLELEDAARISDDMRLKFFEDHRLPLLMEDGDVSSAFGEVWLAASDGRHAVMPFDIQGYSFSGLTTTWYGPYLTKADFVSWLLSRGWLIDPYGFPTWPRERKLQLLRRRISG